MSKRKYEKRSDYWSKFETTNAAEPSQYPEPSFVPVMTGGDPYYTATANTAFASLGARSSATDSERTGSRRNGAAFTSMPDRFSAIRAGLLPFEYSRDGVSVRDAIILCQKAYFNVAICARTVDLMAEMANTEIFLKGSSKKSRDFFSAWMKKAKIRNVAEQFFREFFRSSNVPIYRVDGEFPIEYFTKLTQVYAAEGTPTNSVPIRYIMLNPYDIISKAATSFSVGNYEKILSKFELTRLKDPQTEEDKAFLQSLPPEARKAVAERSWQTDGIKVKLDPSKLIFCFRKKQDYEPFAVPFLYPILDDINAKIELKKMDQAITRTVENVILLITHGAKKEDGGINPANGQALQNIFTNPTMSRILVADFTTKGEFIIPDLNKVLGPEKYQVLNDDIREGLANILLGEEKYGNTQTKVKIFLEGLKEARNTFIDEFLQPEIKRVAKNLGFRDYPLVKMKEVAASENTQFQRVVTRLMELGLIDAKNGIQTIQNGEFPDVEEESFMSSQEEYISERKKGLWMPMSPTPIVSPPIDKNNLIKQPASPSGASAPKNKKKVKVLTQSGRPAGSLASLEEMKASIYQTQELFRFIRSNLMSKLNLNELSEGQEGIVSELSKKIISAEYPENWLSLASKCVNDDNYILNLYPLQEVLDIMSEHNLGEYEAAIVYHSTLSSS